MKYESDRVTVCVTSHGMRTCKRRLFARVLCDMRASGGVAACNELDLRFAVCSSGTLHIEYH